MQANKKPSDICCGGVVAGRFSGFGVLVPGGGVEGVLDTLLGSIELADSSLRGGWWIVLPSGSRSSDSTVCAVYINLPTTSRLNNLLEDFSLCAYLD